jgi:hypothetical protein
MAIGTITWDSGDNAIAINGVSTTSRAVGVSVSGVTSGRWYVFVLRAKGSNTQIGTSTKVQAASTTVAGAITVTDTTFLTALSGATRNGTTLLQCLYYMYITEWIGDPDNGGTLQTNKSSTDGVATINPRATAGSCTDFDLDNSASTVTATWTRPSTHGGWRIRLVFYVNGVACITRTGYQSSMSAYLPSSAELTSMLNAMGGVSPRAIYARVYTGWVFADTTYYDTASYASTSNGSIIKSFVGFVYLKVSGVMQKCEAYVKEAGVMKRVHAYVRDTTWKESK